MNQERKQKLRKRRKSFAALLLAMMMLLYTVPVYAAVYNADELQTQISGGSEIYVEPGDSFKRDSSATNQDVELCVYDGTFYIRITGNSCPIKAGVKQWRIEDISGSAWQPLIVNLIPVTDPNRYTVKYVDQDGTSLQEFSDLQVYEKTSEYTGETPTKASDAEYDYVFAGWEPEVSEYVKADAVYTAKYNKVKKSYKVTFVDEDSTVLKAATAYEYGTKAADIVQPATPSKQETETCTYEFAGWSPELQDVTADATYTAVYKEIAKEITYTAGSIEYLLGSKEDKELVVKGNIADGTYLDHFDSVKIGDTVLVRDTDYTAREGSLILNFKSDCLEKYKAGKYDITIEFDNGTATGVLTVKAPAEKTDKPNVKETTPKQTGDLGYSELFFILMLLSIAGFITVISMKKKERN